MKTLILCSAILAIVLTGCVPGTMLVVGSGRVATETRAVSNFDAVSLSGVGDLTITQGETEGLVVEAEDNLMPYLKTEVRNGTLAIYIDGRPTLINVNPTKSIRYMLTVKDLRSLELSGAGRIVSGSLKSDHLTVRISGAGGITLDHVEAANVTSTLSGAGGLKMVGQVVSQVANLSGVGGYDATELSSQNASVSVSGLGGATVWASNSLDVTISGAGSVKYYGSPRVQKMVSGLGRVTRLGSK